MSDPGFEATVVPPPDAPLPAAAAAPQEACLPIRFTGSGSEYFRIWIVNLLLMLLTLSLYYPWAKVRRLRYFYANTLVGEQPLGFHAAPRRMLRGYLLVALMLLLYSVAGKFSPLAGLLAFVLVAIIWPALLQASLRFRLANTSWRGLRFRFRGSVRGAYAALLPFFVPGLLIIASLVFVPDQDQPPLWYGLLTIAVLLGSLALLPWWWWRLKKYQHDHYAYGPEQTRLRTGAGSFYGVFAETLGIGAAGAIAVGVLVAMLVFAVAALGSDDGSGGAMRKQGLAVLIGLLMGLGALLVVQLVPRPYLTARMQNLLWSQTASRAVGFASTLRFWPLFGLTLKNWLLMVATLGLYWPFAAVAVHRKRVEAVQVLLHVDPQTLADEARAADNDAAGDAAGDLFGLDIGL